jgi:hypothetical protein
LGAEKTCSCSAKLWQVEVRWKGGRRSPSDLEMGIIHVDAPSTLLCGEGRNSSPGLGGVGDELAEVGSGIDFLGAADGAVFPLDTDEAVRELIEKEMDHQPQSGYAERLERGGLEASWRKHAMRWICKVKSLGFICSSRFIPFVLLLVDWF